jgi:EAL domain-containing protein (putative c-di-GMP-specific phosphodiesterase class I)
VAIDDFGTGGLTLPLLTEISPDFVKIDRTFVRRLPDDRSAADIVAAAVAVGRTIRIRPVAVGVETDEALPFLLDAGCDLGQGYHFARPVPAPEVAVLARTALARRVGRHVGPEGVSEVRTRERTA